MEQSESARLIGKIAGRQLRLRCRWWPAFPTAGGAPVVEVRSGMKKPAERALVCGLISPRSEPLIGHMDAVTVYA